VPLGLIARHCRRRGRRASMTSAAGPGNREIIPGGGSLATVRRLHQLSLAILIGGILLTIAAVIFSLSEIWTLSGLLLAIAGGVKLVVVYLWRNVIQIEHVEGTVHKG
jgi:hypothetical protein